MGGCRGTEAILIPQFSCGTCTGHTPALLVASLNKVQLAQGTAPHKGNEVTRQELGAAGGPWGQQVALSKPQPFTDCLDRAGGVMRLTAQGWGNGVGSRVAKEVATVLPYPKPAHSPFSTSSTYTALNFSSPLCPIPTKSCSIRHTCHTSNSSQEGDILVPGASCRY